MRSITCDRCGKVQTDAVPVDRANSILHVTLRYSYPDDNSSEYQLVRKDFCSPCNKVVADFMGQRVGAF